MNPVARSRLLRWFAGKKRDLPWRGEGDPYRILVSEIMLQQTTVRAVGPAYGRFLEAFPTVRALASAEVDAVLAAWAGLGYYRRARSLHEACREIGRRGGWPKTADELARLPGIGPYTAAAVASIAFGEPVPVLDGNVIRVMSRLAEVPGDPHRAAVRRRLLDVAAGFVDPRRPGDSNQAMMELGATVCRPVDPSCDACPLSVHCQARMHGTQASFPAPKALPASVAERHAVYVVRDEEGRYLIEQKKESGALQGLWGFPLRGPLDGAASPGGARVGTARHAIMNRRLTLEIYEAERAPAAHGALRRYASLEEIRSLPRSSIVEKVLKRLGRA